MQLMSRKPSQLFPMKLSQKFKEDPPTEEQNPETLELP